MAKILAVFGATGQQGGSVVDYVLNDPELSQQYKIRAITRDVNSDKAKQLKAKAQENIEVVHGDVLNPSSLAPALAGAHTVFAMTAPSFAGDAAARFDAEYAAGRAIADAAVASGASYLIFSTLPSISEISGGKYTKVTSFDAKAAVEQYIRRLRPSIRSAFYCPGSFMENFAAQPFLGPQRRRSGSEGEAEDTWVMAMHNSPQSRTPLIDAVGDTGKFVGAILADPDRYEGKTFFAAVRLYSLEEIAAVMSRATGKRVVYEQISVEEFKESLKGLPFDHDLLVEAFSYREEFGYFGPDSEKLVAWAVENVRGRLTTLEEYLEKHPLQLA
ncbi:hypothetical protein VTK56DRAFT_7490 [Thermocarpiscus australiensis]